MAIVPVTNPVTILVNKEVSPEPPAIFVLIVSYIPSLNEANTYYL